MRILLVEDSTPTRQMLTRSLQGAGAMVSTAARLATGLRLAAEETFAVIVLDIMLPDGSGLDLCRAIRKMGITTPILFLTAKGEVGDRVAGLDAGGDDYLRKPFAIAEFLARVRALARRQGLAPPARLEWKNVNVDFTARRLRRDGGEVVLTGREWAVLEILASHTDRVVAREDLLELLWHSTSSAASQSLEVIVCRLRRKLGFPDGEGVIRTVRGRGYAFELPQCSIPSRRV